jgi:ATP-binding cassette subfamily F protein uup
VRQRPALPDAPPASKAPAAAPATPVAAPTAPVTSKKRKLSYKETKELEALPDRIATLEGERDAAAALLADPNVLRDGQRVLTVNAGLAKLEDDLLVAMARWEELETLASA